ncbi:MAG: hypothetical protein AAF725_03495 [Acidobacteriota bacterium]
MSRRTGSSLPRRWLFTAPRALVAGGWRELARELEADAAASCAPDAAIETRDEPVWREERNFEDILLDLEEMDPAPRSVRLEPWCEIEGYAGLSVLLGSRIGRKERRALGRRLAKSSLRGETLLREHEGAWDEDAGRVFGYRLDGRDAGDRAALEHLLMPLDAPLYLAERWMLMGSDERPDLSSFEAIQEVGQGLALFLTRTGEAEERLFEGSTAGGGWVAGYPDDEAWDLLVRDFARFRDLPILMAEAPSAGMRVTSGRSADERPLVVVYGAPHEPEIETPILFMY